MNNKKTNQKSYSYPLDDEWSTKEIIDVIHFFECIEHAYEKGVAREKVINNYKRFKEIVPSKAREKRIFAEFEQKSGYSPYRTVRQAREGQSIPMINMLHTEIVNRR